MRKKEPEAMSKGGEEEEVDEEEEGRGEIRSSKSWKFAQQLQAPTESATHEREQSHCMAQ